MDEKDVKLACKEPINSLISSSEKKDKSEMLLCEFVQPYASFNQPLKKSSFNLKLPVLNTFFYQTQQINSIKKVLYCNKTTYNLLEIQHWYKKPSLPKSTSQ